MGWSGVSILNNRPFIESLKIIRKLFTATQNINTCASFQHQEIISLQKKYFIAANFSCSQLIAHFTPDRNHSIFRFNASTKAVIDVS